MERNVYDFWLLVIILLKTYGASFSVVVIYAGVGSGAGRTDVEVVWQLGQVLFAIVAKVNVIVLAARTDGVTASCPARESNCKSVDWINTSSHNNKTATVANEGWLLH